MPLLLPSCPQCFVKEEMTFPEYPVIAMLIGVLDSGSRVPLITVFTSSNFPPPTHFSMFMAPTLDKILQPIFYHTAGVKDVDNEV